MGHRWAKGSPWARRNFRCDFKTSNFGTCGRPVTRLLWRDTRGGELPDGGYCYAHYLELKKRIAVAAEPCARKEEP